MVREIIWTKRANHNFNRIITYLEEEWGEKVTVAFVKKTYLIIDMISKYPSIGTLENTEKNIHGFLITPHNRLFYRFSESQLFLLNFFDTRQGSTSNKF